MTMPACMHVSGCSCQWEICLAQPILYVQGYLDYDVIVDRKIFDPHQAKGSCEGDP